MLNSGILIKTFEKNFLETGNLVAFYSFSNPSGNIVFNDLYTSGDHFVGGDSSKIDVNLHPAISVGSTSNPTATNPTGSGYFDYSDRLQVGTGIAIEDWAIFINFLQNTPPSGVTSSVLASTMSTPNDTSGVNIGLNGSNRVYVDFINSSGNRQTHTHSEELSNFNNLVSVSKDGASLEVIYHDFINDKNNLESFDVSGAVNSTNWFVGGMPTMYGGYTGFSGYVDDILITKGGYAAGAKNIIADSFFTTGLESGYNVDVVTYQNEVTGTQLNYTGVTGTGVTGFSSVLVDTINGVPVYQNSGITGLLTGITVNYLTGGLTVSGTGISGIDPYNDFDFNYANKFADNCLIFNKKVDTSLQYEVYSYPTGSTGTRTEVLNNELIYNFDNNTFITLTGYSGQNVNTYMDGEAVYSGSGFGFNDYLITFSGNFGINNTGIYDFINGQQVATPFTGGAGIISLTDSKFFNKDAYLDGSKLISGLAWSGTASAIEVDASSSASGTYFFSPIHSEAATYLSGNRATGLASQFINFNFRLVNEQVWLNGLRQKEGVDYTKTSTYSLLNSNKYLTGFTDLIFNNGTGFFNV
jgi:hypothetical protein|tara:strand:- start:7515 stop:9263 length:1749 start_codon:yes stop_codon:yes gene_type:complete